MYLHKVIIESSDLDYFKSLINNGMKEGLESKLTVEEDEFEVLKIIFEYIYKNEMPEFADETSKTAFEDALNYYRAQGELAE
ncbi:MAG: BTB/POZ domain-containing protein [Parachlamydiaceae bacterium]|nr:MAG: BTB/POZ domain-containing protein [Parachlamydiaceae bacterium]